MSHPVWSIPLYPAHASGDAQVPVTAKGSSLSLAHRPPSDFPRSHSGRMRQQVADAECGGLLAAKGLLHLRIQMVALLCGAIPTGSSKSLTKHWPVTSQLLPFKASGILEQWPGWNAHIYLVIMGSFGEPPASVSWGKHWGLVSLLLISGHN